MNLLQIDYFLALADHLSFSKAAEALFVSQPAVSMQISSLEKEWGVQFFFRKYRSVALTPAGEIMYQTLQSVASDFENGLERARRIQSSPKSTICIGVPEYTDLGNIPEIFAQFRQENPEISLEVESCPIAQIILPKANGKFDLVINHRFMLENEDELNFLPFAKGKFAFIISNEHPLTCQNPSLRIADLGSDTVPVYLPTREDTQRVIDHCKYICISHGFTPGEVILTPNVNSALLAAKMGAGVALLDDLILIPRGANLRFLKTEFDDELVVAWRRDKSDPALALLAQNISDQINLAQT